MCSPTRFGSMYGMRSFTWAKMTLSAHDSGLKRRVGDTFPILAALTQPKKRNTSEVEVEANLGSRCTTSNAHKIPNHVSVAGELCERYTCRERSQQEISQRHSVWRLFQKEEIVW